MMLKTFTLCLLLSFGLTASGQEASPVEKGDLLYENAFSSPKLVEDWTMEGPGQTAFKAGWMHLFSPDEESHHVFWCPVDFPSSFVAEWELQNLETDAGLCIIFFAATGIHGEDIFDPSLKKRDGIFSKYTKSDLNNYHISYYANADGNNRDTSHLRKNAGFHIVQSGEMGIPITSTAIHRVRLEKRANQILMFIDDRKIIDWTDDGQTYGKALKGGKIGFRQMKWTHFRYRNFKVWELKKTPPTAAAGWVRHTIDASSSGADGVKLADINRDGRPDIVTGWEEGGLTKLYLNPGAKKVKKEWPAVVVGHTPNVEDAVFADIDNDGRLDIVSCTENGSEKIYIQKRPKKKFLKAEKWTQEVLPASDGRMMWMYAEPLQIDGQFGSDLLAAGKGEKGQLGWFEAPAMPSDLSQWKWHSITPVGWVMSILIRDMDSDGDMDVILTDRRDNLQACRWLENPGKGPAQKMPWKNHVIGAKGLEVMFMAMADLDGDGKEEAVVAERTNQTIRIYRRQDKAGLTWQEQIISLPKQTGSAKSVEVGDINGDGRQDLVISTNTNGLDLDGIIWLDGKDSGKDVLDADFQSISGAHHAKNDKVELIDLDNDGDLDVLICEENYGLNSEGLGVIWYENKLKEP